MIRNALTAGAMAGCAILLWMAGDYLYREFIPASYRESACTFFDSPDKRFVAIRGNRISIGDQCGDGAIWLAKSEDLKDKLAWKQLVDWRQGDGWVEWKSETLLLVYPAVYSEQYGTGTTGDWWEGVEVRRREVISGR